MKIAQKRSLLFLSIFSLLIVGVILFLSIFSSFPKQDLSNKTSNQSTRVFSLESFNSSVKSCDNPNCIYDLFETLTKDLGAEKALEVLSGDVLKGTAASCHQVAHVIGKSSISRVEDLEANLKIESYLCTFGFQHGVIEGAGRSLSDSDYLKYIPKFCESFPNGTSADACLHGLGHALTARMDGDLDRVQEGCLLYPKGPNRFYCFDGAIMEWANIEDREEIVGYLKEDNGAVEISCDRFLKDGSLYAACIRNIWSIYQNPSIGFEINDPYIFWSKKLAFCASVGGFINYCVEGVTATVSNQIFIGSIKPATFARFCDSIKDKYKDGQQHCEFALARWPMISQVDTSEFLPICQSIFGKESRCESYVEMLFSEMRNGKDPRAN